jgi:hypothetical protein
MNRQQVIAKIQAMLNLQNGTDFEGEASAAAALIDKLCKQYGVSLNDATETQVLDEIFVEFKRINNANATLLNAVAVFYDAKAYIQTYDHCKAIKLVGSEAQQIQTKLYYEYLYEVMMKEAETAYEAEKVLADIQGNRLSRSFKSNFCKAFASKVSNRLREMKIAEGRVHQDAEAVRKQMSGITLRKRTVSAAHGEGAYAGHSSGSSVSLRRQATGGSQRVLAGY